MDRRKFLCRSAITTVGLGLASPLLECAAFGAPRRGRAALGAGDTAVVALNLYGGNDGLNTVIPISQYATYKSYRPTLAVPQERALRLRGTSDVALNPAMTGIRDLYDAGKVAVIPGVGAPQDAQGLFDHEAQQRGMQSANPMSPAGQSGWLGRYLDTIAIVPDRVLPPGVDLGGGRLVVDGYQSSAITLTSVGEFRIQTGFDSEARSAIYARMMRHAAPSGAAEQNRLVRKAAVAQAELLRGAVENYQPAVAYPDGNENPVSASLLQCAQLLAADLDVRAITVGYNGFDTHVGQNDAQGAGSPGFHDQLLGNVSSAVEAFYRDLEAHGLASKVLTLVFSEFGRRPKENSERGTDHGYGSAWFVVGGSVVGGVYGGYPSIAEGSLVLGNNVAVTTDFRSVYATILAGHLNGDPEAVLGGDFPPLGFL